MKKISLIFTFVVLCVALFAMSAFAASFTRGPEGDTITAEDIESIELTDGSKSAKGEPKNALDGLYNTYWAGATGNSIRITLINEWEITTAKAMLAGNWCFMEITFYDANNNKIGSASNNIQTNYDYLYGGDATNGTYTDYTSAVKSASYADSDNGVKYIIVKNTGDKWGYLPNVFELVFTGRERIPSVGCENHQFEAVYTKEPTCTEAGTMVNRCTLCGAEEAPVAVAALGHNLGEYRIKTPATCISAPVIEFECTRCGTTLERDVNVEDVTDYGDVYTIEGVAGGGTSFGSILDNNMDSYAMASGGWYVEEKMNLDMAYYISGVTVWVGNARYDSISTHSAWLILFYQAPGSDEWVEAGRIETPAKLMSEKYEYILELETPVYADAVKVFVGSPTGEYDGQGPGLESYNGCVYEAKVAGSIVPDTAAGHTWVAGNTVAADCDDFGYTTYACSVCGATKTADKTDPLGHTWVDADCFAPKTCSVCAATTGDPKGHKVTHVDAVAATCFENGNIEYWYCEICGYAWADAELTQVTNLKSVVTPMAHDTLTHVEAKAATCFENGNIEYWYCETCGYAWLDADCTLNTNLKAVVLPMAHGTITHVEAKAATCTENGNIEYWYCEACGYAWLDAACTLNTNLKAVVLPAGHQWSETPEDVVAATCVSKGTGKYFCVNCWAYDEETGEVETPINPENHPNMEFTNELYNFAACPDCDAFSFYGMNSGIGDNDLTWYFMGDVINIYNDTIDECYKATVAYNEETGVYTFTLSAVSEEDYGYATTYVGCTATLVINEDGTFMITLAVSEDSALVFGKDPNVIEPENYLLNGVYAYYDMGGNVMIKLEFYNGTIYVLEDNMGAGFPESFAYNYYPATDTIETPDVAYANFYVYDGQIYFGRGFLLEEVEDEPETPDEPEINYGSIIGSFVVETTDTYGYFDLYSYTAEKAGQYSFFVPSGLGFYTKAMYDTYDTAEVDFYENYNGEYAVINLAAGETIEFYIGSTIKSEWEIEVYFYSAHTHTEVVIPAIRPTPSVVGYTAGVKCSECNEILVAPVEITVEDIKSDDFKFKSASLTLAENISVNYKAIVTGGYSDFYVVFLFEGFEFVVTDYTVEEDTGLFVFNFAETRPQLMASNITAYIYGVDAEGNYVRNVQDNYSVMRYCSNQLKNNQGNAARADYYEMISNVVALGAATQLYMGVNTDALVTDLIEDQGYEIKATQFTTIDASWNKQTLTGDRTQGADWKSANLTLGGSTEMNLKFEADSVEGLVVKIVIGGIEYYYDAEDFGRDGNRYVVTLTQITALQFDEVVTATFEKDGVQFGSTLEYSIGTYLQKNFAKDNNQADLIKALYLYGTSVYNYYR